MIGLCKEKPTLGEQADILNPKRGSEYIGALFEAVCVQGQSRPQQEQWQWEHQYQKYPFNGFEEQRPHTVKKFARVEGTAHEAL